MPVTPAWRILPKLEARIVKQPGHAWHPVPENQRWRVSSARVHPLTEPVRTHSPAAGNGGSRSSRRRLLAASATTIVSVRPSTAIPIGMGGFCAVSWKTVRS